LQRWPQQVPRGEALVPLLVFTTHAQLQREFRSAATSVVGATSHFELFPTLLFLMGYDREWINREFGIFLIDTSKRKPRRFLAGISESDLTWKPAD
jgi:hypothetical protein